MKSYYVIYQVWNEWNTFGEGEWNVGYTKYESRYDAIKDVEKWKINHNYRDIIGPLQSIKTEIQ